MRRFVASALAASAMMFVAAPAARAEIVHDRDAPAGALALRLTEPRDRVVLSRAGELLHVSNGYAPPVGFEPPPLARVDGVWLTDASGSGVEVVIDLRGGRLERPGGTLPLTVDLGGDPGADTLRIVGEPGRDNIRVGAVAGNLDALEDDEPDVFARGLDRWILEGGGGHDLLSAGGGPGLGGPTPLPVEILAGPGGGVFGGGAGDDLIRGADGNDSLIGGTGDDQLSGGGGSDKVSGGAGNDVVENGSGADDLAGGSGRDRLTHGGIGSAVRIDLGGTAPQAGGGAGPDVISGIEMVDGTRFDDFLGGDDGANALRGGPGHDSLVGRGGHDVVGGDEGNDTLSGDQGRDLVDGGDGRDSAGYATAPGGVSVRIGPRGEGASSAASGRDVLSRIEDIIGSPHNDSLTGNGEANRLSGGAGRDSIDGGAGEDAIEGGGGDDALQSADGARDHVECGAGRDVVAADASDAVARDCEPARLVIRKPRRLRPGPPGPIRVLGITYRRGAAAVRVRLRCPGAARFACRGDIRLMARVSRRGVRERRSASDRVRFTTILAGRRGSARVALARHARRALRRAPRGVALVVRVRARDQSRANLSTRVVVRPERLPGRLARRQGSPGKERIATVRGMGYALQA